MLGIPRSQFCQKYAPNVNHLTGINKNGRVLMPEELRNVDGSPIKDVEEKKPGCLVLLALIFLTPIFLLGKLY